METYKKVDIEDSLNKNQQKRGRAQGIQGRKP